jgi:isopentenyl-diphosphate Delta-isomerase
MDLDSHQTATETSSQDELIVFVDNDGNPVGTGRKAESHHSDTQLHLAFSVFLFNRDGELLLQQRALSKKTWPGVWSNSCCGHLLPGERTEDAAARRLSYELGLKDIELVMALPDFRYRAELDGVVEHEICPVLVGFTDSLPQPNPDEVNAVRWMPWSEVLRTVADPESKLSPWAIEEVQLLAQSDVFSSQSRIAGAGRSEQVT